MSTSNHLHETKRHAGCPDWKRSPVGTGYQEPYDWAGRLYAPVKTPLIFCSRAEVPNLTLSERDDGPSRYCGWPILFVSQVLSASQPTLALFAHKQGHCRELGHFQRAVDLVVTFGDRAPEAADSVVALVTPQVGDGPFHLVVDALPPALTGPVPVWWEASRLRIGPWALVMAPRMQITSPTPCWNKLTIQPSRFRRLRDHVAVESATRRERSPAAVTMTDAVSTRTHALCRALQARDVPAIRQTAGGLAGVGVGLTPSGDDVLAGVLLALWAALGAHHAGERALLIEAICEAAVPRTTRLSRAFLEAASRGEVDVRWHRLLDALSGASDARLDEAVRDVLAFGASSGLDMLGGFVSAFEAVRRAD